MSQSRFIELLAKKESGEITLLEQKELSDLISANDELNKLANLFKSSYGNLPPFNKMSEDEMEAGWQKLSAKIKFDTRTNSRVGKYAKFKRPLLVAASIIIIVALSVFGYLYTNEPESIKSHNIVSTKKGSKSNIVLPDGTQVWLNADSKITYEKSFGGKTREIRLDGEAFFDVVHDADRPFIIHTGNADIKVLGTTFNVRNYTQEDFVETSLIKGKIEVTLLDQPDKKIVLKPTEKLVVYKTDKFASVDAAVKRIKHPEIMRLTHVSVNNSQIAETVWMQNSMSFINKPLVEIARELERQYNINVVFRSDKAKNYHYTIYLDNYSLDDAVEALKTLKNFNYSINNNELVIE